MEVVIFKNMDQNQSPQPENNPEVVTVAKKVSPLSKLKQKNKGMFSWVLGGIVSKDSIMLGIIVVLIIVIIGLSTATIGSVTNSGVNITFTKPGDEPSVNQSSPDSSDVSNSTAGLEPTSSPNSSVDSSDAIISKDLTIFLLASKADNAGKSFPSGSKPVDLGGGQADFYLVPVEVKVKVEEGQELETALKYLFGQDNVIYEGIVLFNYLDDSDLNINVLKDVTGVQVQLAGSPVFSGTLSPVYFKAQLEETIKAYSESYAITLNGSTSDYQNLGSGR